MIHLAFISGAGSGLGKKIAYMLAERKIPLFLTSKNAEKLEEIALDLKRFTDVIFFPQDLTKDLSPLLEKIRLYAPDCIINSAGIGLYGDILSFSLEKQKEILQVNIDALVQISIEAARVLKEKSRKGVIMNISSAAAFFTYPSFALYASSKNFVKEFSLSFDEELSPYGIRVLTSLPGRFASNFKANACLSKKKAFQEQWDTMNLEKTAASIIKQIEHRKRYQVMDLRYQILCGIGRLLPRRWLAKRLRKEVAKIMDGVSQDI